MRLTESNIHHYLLDKCYLNPKQFIEGDYTLESDRSRNAIFKVYQKTKQSLFVKQLVEIHPQNTYLLQKDATTHTLIKQTDCYQSTRKYIPNFIGYDSSNQILVTELFPFAKNLHEIILENKTLSIVHSRTVAEILSSFHQPIKEELKSNPSLQFFNQQLPWILTIGDVQGLADIPNGLVIKQIFNYPSLINGIERLRVEWQSISLIHGDIKWVNFVCTSDDELKLIDWEIANIGDPLWDVAGVLQSYLSSWIFSYDNTILNHQKVVGQEYISIPSIQKGIQAFWKRYIELKKYSQEEANKALLISTRMAGARLLQTAFEANQQPHLLPNTVRAIQLCEHLFNHPKQLISELFGFTNYSYETAEN